jgi:hypothetical protein
MNEASLIQKVWNNAQMSKVMTALFKLDPDPVNEGINFVQDVSKIIASSDNVYAFRKPPPKTR